MPTVKFKANPDNLVPITDIKKKNSVIIPIIIQTPKPRIHISSKKYNLSSLTKLKNSLSLLEKQITKKNKVLIAFKESDYKKPKRKLQSALANYRKLLKAINVIINLSHEDCR